MADIDVVPKRRSYTWVWVVVALIVLAALWLFMQGGDTATTTAPVGLVF